MPQIDKSNVAKLKPAWTYQLRRGGLIESSPIVADGIMYITEPPSTVTALDVRTGRMLWTWTPEMPQNVWVPSLFPVNRGVAVLDDTVFVGTLDAQMAALDAKTGALRWIVRVADNKLGYGIASAPLWDFNVGGGVRANPIAYAVDGKQHVAISAGTTFFVFALP